MKYLKVLALVGVIAALVFFGREAASRIPVFTQWVQSLGVWGPVVFIAAYSMAAVFLIPGFLLTMAAGALWGVGLGIAYVMVGAGVGATLAFLSGRYLARARVHAYVERHPRLAAIDRAVEHEGLRLVFLLRLSPLVPFNLLNYVLGISRVRVRDYIGGLAGMTPAVAMYVYFGKVAGDLASLAAGASPPRGPLYWSLLIVGLAATAVATILITRAAKRSLEASTPLADTGIR